MSLIGETTAGFIASKSSAVKTDRFAVCLMRPSAVVALMTCSMTPSFRRWPILPRHTRGFYVGWGHNLGPGYHFFRGSFFGLLDECRAADIRPAV